MVASGSVSTRKFGANFHVAVVTAKAEGTVLVPGAIDSYDITIDNLPWRSWTPRRPGLS